VPGSPTHVGRLRRDQLRPVAGVLAAAFHDDPLFGWFFPDAAARPVLASMWMRTSAEASLAAGHAFVATADGAVVGAALWAPPEVDLFGDGGFVPLWHLLVGANPSRVGEVAEGLGLLGGAHPHDEPHFYLNTIGVAPDRRGRGEGRALIEPVLEQADREGFPCYLESSNPRNVSFYERLGFRVLDEIRLPGASSAVRPMWRDVRPAGSTVR
jgi:ribosomal protein S18 acetylase RimI-like enzyme